MNFQKMLNECSTHIVCKRQNLKINRNISRKMTREKKNDVIDFVYSTCRVQSNYMKQSCDDMTWRLYKGGDE